MTGAVEELRIGDGPIEAVVLPEVGARLHRLRAFGHDVLRTPADPGEHVRDPFFWGAYVMAPWCGRIAPGPVEVGTRRIALESNFPDGSAIHGQVYARRWDGGPERGSVGAFRIEAGGDAWPWTYEVTTRFEVVGTTLRIQMGLTNRTADPMPAGLGIHPWFRRPLEVAIRGEAVYASNVASRPDPEPVPVSGALDLREVGPMADDLDATWAGLARTPVELRWPDARIRASMRIAAPTSYVVAASPGYLDAIAVEPQTHAPQGIRRMLDGAPGGLAMLAPGATLDIGVELAFERMAGAEPEPATVPRERAEEGR